MARVTVEDCIDKVDSPYELVLVAKERATQLNSGIEPTLDRDNDKNTVISLTVNSVEGNGFGINIIPHTWENTSFKFLTTGNNLNIEIDVIARYVERLMNLEES